MFTVEDIHVCIYNVYMKMPRRRIYLPRKEGGRAGGSKGGSEYMREGGMEIVQEGVQKEYRRERVREYRRE